MLYNNTCVNIFIGIIFIHSITALITKRSKPNQDFPDYSLRFTYPNICDTTSKHTSGYFELPDGKNFFFWFFESRSNPKKDPLALWLNGGPGCSSMLGLFMEIGPCRVNAKGDGLLNNQHSWTNKANILFLDQPVNSGYSYHNGSTYLSDSDSASKEIYIFLQLFYKEFPQFAMSDFHIAGESYAGHFLPAIANTIYQENKQEVHHSIPLKSIIIGNGLIDPLIQYQYYKSMACDNPSYENLISSYDNCQRLEIDQDECKKAIENCYEQNDFTTNVRSSSIDACKMATSICNIKVVKSIIDKTKQNIYDIRKKCEDGPMCYDYFNLIRTYLNRSEVKHTLGVSSSMTFELCNNSVNSNFQNSGDWMRPYVYYLSTLLDNNIRVLAYAGDSDFMCNWMGVKAWTKNLVWQGQINYNNQNDTDWFTTSGEYAGKIKQNHRLAFVRLFNAGHMAPYDQPEVTLDMFNRWILDKL